VMMAFKFMTSVRQGGPANSSSSSCCTRSASAARYIHHRLAGSCKGAKGSRALLCFYLCVQSFVHSYRPYTSSARHSSAGPYPWRYEVEHPANSLRMYCPSACACIRSPAACGPAALVL
jgi:hypothetical protein